MTRFYLTVFFLLINLQLAFANVEKVIFLAPSSVQIPTQNPTLEDLQLHTLSPQNSTVKTKLRAEFPTNASIWGESSWVLLDQLAEGQRYEVRICWAATQPTSFRLSVYGLSEVFDSPELIMSLANYSKTLQPETKPDEGQPPTISRGFKKPEHGTEQLQSVLLLHILAAADYYTVNRALMEHVPPVFVDIILDPYVLNILPRSLVPTGVYLIILAISSWFLAQYIAKWLHMVARTDEQKKDS